jgi:hypothetical protein
MLSEEATNTNFIVFGLTRTHDPPLEASTLTITPPLRLTIVQDQYRSTSTNQIVLRKWSKINYIYEKIKR